jgi:apolipoprotein N-acyltransferase
VWTGLEFARAHLFTGFLLASIAHTQVNRPAVIQISDLVGEYGVDFLMVMVAAGVASVLFPPRRALALVPVGVVLAAAIGYGHWRLNEAVGDEGEAATARIALIQGNSLAEWKQDPNRERQIMDEYVALSDRAVALARERGDGRPLDVVIWPETMFRSPLVDVDSGYQPPPGAIRTPEEAASYGRRDLASLAARLGAPVLVGVERWRLVAAPTPGDAPPPQQRFNSAALVDRDGRIIGSYDKVHRVMFGEYIPFAEWLPFLYRWTPLTGGVTAGAAPVVLQLDNRSYSPNICYETVVSHLIRDQAAKLAEGGSPRLLVNLTNDAWYWGSAGLDLHLACGVFRAVESRTPLVIAANGGLSAVIDDRGRIIAHSPRQQADVIVEDVELARGAPSPYVRFGDWFAGACLAWSLAVAVVGWRERRRRAAGDGA